MNEIKFVVNAVPVAQPRQRHRAVEGPSGIYVQNYTPGDHPVSAFKDAVHLAAAGSVMWLLSHGGMLTGPLEARLIFVMPRPKKLRNGPRVPFKRKPDSDNFAKSVLDALSKRIYVDDSQVCRLIVEKWYAAFEEKPHVEVEIAPMDLSPAREKHDAFRPV